MGHMDPLPYQESVPILFQNADSLAMFMTRDNEEGAYNNIKFGVLKDPRILFSACHCCFQSLMQKPNIS